MYPVNLPLFILVQDFINIQFIAFRFVCFPKLFLVQLVQSVCRISLHFSGGLICFNIRDGKLVDYQGTISELETSGKWEKVSKTVIPFFESDGMPKETMVFTYKVLDVIT